jgi:hypothetical protein
MIESCFGEYLIKYKDIKISYNFLKTKSKIGVILVATKSSFWLPLIIKNILHKIKNCNLYLYSSIETINFLRKNLKEQFNGIYYCEVNIRNIKDYNKMLLDVNFWKIIPNEYILITQPDCILLRDINEDDLKYDYIGAVCGDLNNYIINGGLSIRKKETMIEICKNLSNKEKSGDIAEDIIFTNKIKEKYKVPSINECMNFSIESIGNLEKVLGIHGTDKYYINNDIKNNFINKWL